MNGYYSTNTAAADCSVDFRAVSAKAHENLFFAGFVFRALQETPKPSIPTIFKDYCNAVGREYDREEYNRLYINLRSYSELLNIEVE